MIRLTPEEHELRLRLYEELGSDREAAAALGLSRTAFYEWRARAGVPAKRGRALPEEERLRRLAIYRRSKSDVQAAREAGISPNAWARWRRTEDLPPYATPKPRVPRDDARYHRAYQACVNDAQAALAVGIPRRDFTCWRHRNNLPAKFLSRPANRVPQEVLLEAWYTSTSILEIARKVNVSPAWLRAWMKANDLPRPGLGRYALANRFDADEQARWQAYCQTLNDTEAAQLLNTSRKSMTTWRKKRGLPIRSRTHLFLDAVRTHALQGNPFARSYLRQRFPKSHGLD